MDIREFNDVGFVLRSECAWWLGISHDIENMIKESTCAKRFSPRKEPMILTELPQYPWQKVGVDLFQLKGSNYLVVVDYYSRYPEVHKLNSTTADAIIHTLKSTFSRFGIPETVISDNGPQFSLSHLLTLPEDMIFNTQLVVHCMLRAMAKQSKLCRQSKGS